jgi:hypothetical protein
MNKLLILLYFTSLYTINTFSQNDAALFKPNWKPGKEKVIYGNTILRHEGNNTAYDGNTNIGYKTYDQLIEEMSIDAEKEMWTNEKKERFIQGYKDNYTGGMIVLQILRLDIDRGNTKNFTVIVQDPNEEEIFRKELENKIPEGQTWSHETLWSNYANIGIPEKIDGNIIIYVIDALSDKNTRHKFEVKF